MAGDVPVDERALISPAGVVPGAAPPGTAPGVPAASGVVHAAGTDEADGVPAAAEPGGERALH
ncbi:hypothetical protein MXD58_011750, partial [Frankia sp. AgKG'84/4]|nr:hypothetical protein [Frankia sp. AgKG'84/4]